MVSSSSIEGLAARFAPYIDELREFFTSRQVPFGSPELLAPFVDRLNDPALAEEMGSMLRSFLYREEQVPRTEWMEMIAVAVGGPQVEDRAEALHEPLRRLLAFVGEVIHSQRTGVPLDFSSLDETPQLDSAQPPPDWVAENTPALPVEADPAAGFQLRSAPDGNIFAMNPPSSRINDRLAQSLAASTLPEPLAVPGPAETTARTSGHATMRDVPGPRPRRTLLAVLQRSYWLPGVAVLLLVLIAGWFVRMRATHQPGPATAVAPPIAVVNRPKPSPYTPSAPNTSRTSAEQHHSESPVSAPSHEPFVANSAGNRPALLAPGEGRLTPVPPLRGAHASRATLSMNAHGGLIPGEGVFLASSGAMASHLISAPAPGYPRLASFTHVEGQVILQVVVARDGTVEATRVLDGPRLLRGAAEHAVRRWRYRPYTVDGRPTDVATIVTVSFRLRH